MEGQELLGKLTDIKGFEISGEQIIIDGVKFHPNRVAIAKDADIDGWRKAGIFVQRTQQSNLWWLGDWSLAGQEKFGEEASQYASSEHFSEAYMRRATWVCRKIEPSRRVKELSFEHHAAVAGLPEADQDRWLRRALEKQLSLQDLRRAMRKQAEKKRYVEDDLPDGRYRVIYANPPWKREELGGEEIAADDMYAAMKLEDIKGLKVQELAAKACVLFLWAPATVLQDAFEVLSAWGFTYKTQVVWNRGEREITYYVGIQHENLLIATRGKMVPDAEIAEHVSSVQEFARSNRNITKPEDFREMIDMLYPSIKDGDRIELFARTEVPAPWRKWGNAEPETPDQKLAASGETAEAARDEIAEQAAAAEAEKTNGSGAKKPRLVKTKKRDAAPAEGTEATAPVH